MAARKVRIPTIDEVIERGESCIMSFGDWVESICRGWKMTVWGILDAILGERYRGRLKRIPLIKGAQLEIAMK